MITYSFYIKKSPLENNSFKIGISVIQHLDSRLGTYQNSFGPTYKERFERLWVGPEQDVRELERLLKIQLRSKIAGNKRGFTEWVTDITLDELCDIVQKTINGLGVVVTIPKKHIEVFEEDIAVIKKEYLVEIVD
jgi:hypothetical protein